MGRYDKIKVYNGSEFKQPKRIRAYDGKSFIDLGTNDSDFTRSLYVVDANKAIKRITLNKKIITHTGTRYRVGPVTVSPSNGYCYCPTYKEGGVLVFGKTFLFRAYIRRGAGGSKNIFRSYGIYSSDSNYIRITLNDNNTITVSIASQYASQSPNNITTSSTINPNAWNLIEVRCDRGSYNLVIKINGSVAASATNAWQTWLVSSTNTLGDWDLHIREDNFLVDSCDGNQISRSTTNPIVNANDSYTETTWV